MGRRKCSGQRKILYSPSKKAIPCSTKNGKKSDSERNIFLDGDRVDASNSTGHLGIKRDITGKDDNDCRIDLGGKTAYSLMGAGFHGDSRLRAAQNCHIWSTFAIPRLLYGLEVQLLKKKKISQILRGSRGIA